MRTYAERMSYKPWREAHMLYRAQCGTEEDMDPAVSHVTALSIFMSSGKYIYGSFICQNHIFSEQFYFVVLVIFCYFSYFCLHEVDQRMS